MKLPTEGLQMETEPRRRRPGVPLRVVLGVSGMCCALIAGCGDVYVGAFYGGSGGSDGGSSGTGGTGSGSTSSSGTAEVCPHGTCETLPLSGDWHADEYALIYQGPTGQPVPDCPNGAPLDVWDGHANLLQTTCAACSCQPPNGSCELPTNLKAYYTPVCPAPANASFQPFDAPIGWDGSCTPVNPVMADPNCLGGNCIQGLTIDPPVVKDPPACKLGIPTPMDPVPARWEKNVRMCIGNLPFRVCGDGATLFCAATPPAGFLACVQKKGVLVDTDCPSNFPHKMFAYKSFTDASTCSPCACDAPAGSKCSTGISVYLEKADCTGADQKLIVDSTQPSGCASLPPGAGLLSKRADPPTYTPGSCKPSGGELLNPAEPDLSGARTFCCQ